VDADAAQTEMGEMGRVGWVAMSKTGNNVWGSNKGCMMQSDQ
jgi:hypothetical protein